LASFYQGNSIYTLEMTLSKIFGGVLILNVVAVNSAIMYFVSHMAAYDGENLKGMNPVRVYGYIWITAFAAMSALLWIKGRVLLACGLAAITLPAALAVAPLLVAMLRRLQ
jgi:hypothetical protein